MEPIQPGLTRSVLDFSQEMKSRLDPAVLGLPEVRDPSGAGTRWGCGFGVDFAGSGVGKVGIFRGERNSCLWGGETEARSHPRPALRRFGGAGLSTNPTGRTSGSREEAEGAPGAVPDP